jgi:hypothetical protein
MKYGQSGMTAASPYIPSTTRIEATIASDQFGRSWRSGGAQLVCRIYRSEAWPASIRR